MKPTHVFNLISGPECEVTEMDGSHQKLITDQSSKEHGDRMTALLASTVVRIGSERDITVEFIKKMLSCDKKKILVELRKFSLDNDPNFSFGYPYVDKDGKRQVHEVDVVLDDEALAEKDIMVIKDGKSVPLKCEEYSEVLENIHITVELPRSKETVRFTLLDGAGEKIGQATPKNQRSSHTPIYMRNPVYFVKKENKEPYPVKLDLDRQSIKDIEFLRSKIKEHEGELDTMITFEHPESDYRQDRDKYVTQDMLSIMAFFFPSEAI